MPGLRLSHVCFSYSGAIDVLADVTLDLHDGWTGVVGENGGGKTTLLELIAGRLAPSTGAIELQPAGAVVHLCPQRVGPATAEIASFAGSWTRSASRVRARLRLEPDALGRWATLSPGERKRWQVGAALAARPDLLLLDEPSNHLDAEARALLRDALLRFRGVGLVVSHDRALLEALTTRTLRVHRGRAALYRGSYRQARAEWRAQELATSQAHDRARRDERALRRRLAAERQRQAGAEARISTRRRARGRKDSDARTMAAKNRVRSAEVRASRRVAVLRDASERAAARAAGFDRHRQRGRSLFVDHEPAPKRFLMVLDGQELRAGERVLAPEVRVAVERDSRIHLAGPNGAGKTTLLCALLAAAAIDPRRILFLPQVLEPSAAAALLRDTREADPASRGRILQVAAALGLDPDRLLASAEPSPGEIRKLAIARGLGGGAWAVVLDEPTNHLDLPSVERLEAALVEYPGALVVVCHDEAFARAVTSRVWRLESQQLRVEDPPLG